MSPLELRREFEAEGLRMRDAERRDLSIAWYTAAFSRMEKLKPLREILAPLDPRATRRRQSLAEQRAAILTIAARAGIPVRES